MTEIGRYIKYNILLTIDLVLIKKYFNCNCANNQSQKEYLFDWNIITTSVLFV